MWMNEYEVNEAAARFEDDSVLGPATRTLRNLVYVTNTSSDGWAYWPKPGRAAEKLMALIQTASRPTRFGESGSSAVTAAEVKKAYTPIKSFMTRYFGPGSSARVIVGVPS